GRATAARVELALALAAEHEAELIGVHPRDPGSMPLYVEPSAELVVQQQRWIDDATANSRAIFDAAGKNAGVPVIFHAIEGRSVAVTAMAGRYADLVVVGQTDPDAPVFGTPGSLPEDLIFAVGRPVLVVPYIGATAPF